MKIFKLLAAGFFSVALLLSCNSEQNNKTQSPEKEIEKTVEEAPVINNTKKYEIKSGVVTYKAVTMGMEQKITTSFDDYGALEATDTYMEMMGEKIHTKNIMRDGYTYSISFDEKQATKTKMFGNAAAMAFANLSKDIEEKMNLKRHGKENIVGFECEKMTYDYKEMSTKGTVWSYKGVPLKQEANAMGIEVKMEPVSFEEKSVDKSVFEVPAGFKVIENKINL